MKHLCKISISELIHFDYSGEKPKSFSTIEEIKEDFEKIGYKLVKDKENNYDLYKINT